jgi:hypothetical protein
MSSINIVHFGPIRSKHGRNIKNGRLQITSNYMIKCSQLQLISITNYDDPMSANQHQELPVAAMFVKGSGLNEQSV